jgi:hypothetical protein
MYLSRGGQHGHQLSNLFCTRWTKLVPVQVEVQGSDNFASKDSVYLFFQNNRHQVSNNTTWREGRRTGGGNPVLSGGNRVFLADGRQTKCLDGDRQRTVKLGFRSNSLSFCVTHGNSHVSSYLYTFRCLVGHEVLWSVRK